MSESRNALVNEPIPRADPATLIPDERWEQSQEIGVRQAAGRGRTIRLIVFFVALALVIGFIWASAPPR
jgi:hypothetical protein